jgi:DNA replication protein DnaC
MNPLTESEARTIVTIWKADTLGIPDLEHQQHCRDGRIGYAHPHYSDSAFACPICKQRQDQSKREIELRSRMREAGIPPRYLDLEWNDLEMLEPLPRIQQACTQLDLISLEGESLFLHGPPGSGKTQAAIMIAKTAIRSGLNARVVNIGRLCVDVRRGYSDQGLTESAALESLGTTDFLILDDLGAGETRNATLENRLLYLALEERQNRRLPTIITSNLEPVELVGKLGSRLLNRLQPLTVLEVNHGRNFRAPSGRDSLWDRAEKFGRNFDGLPTL